MFKSKADLQLFDLYSTYIFIMNIHIFLNKVQIWHKSMKYICIRQVKNSQMTQKYISYFLEKKKKEKHWFLSETVHVKPIISISGPLQSPYNTVKTVVGRTLAKEKLQHEFWIPSLKPNILWLIVLD